MLSYSALIKRIRESSFSPVYLFYGEERYLQEEIISHMAAAFLGEDSEHGREKYDGNILSLGQVIEKMEEKGLFSRRKLLIVDNPSYLAPPKRNEEIDDTGEEDLQEKNKKSSAKDDLELLVDYLEETSSEDQQGVLVFLTRAVDRRKKLFKVIDKYGTVMECSPLKGNALASWLRNKASVLDKKIDSQALDKMLLAGNHDLNFLSNELSKYAAYLGSDQEIITTEVVEKLSSGDIQGDVFKLSDAMAEGNIITAQRILDLLFRRREKPLLIFFMLVRHYRLLLQAHSMMKDGLPQQEFASSLGVHPFVAGKLREQAVLYSGHVLEEALISLQDADRQIKTGRIEPERALELILSRIDYIQGNSQDSV